MRARCPPHRAADHAPRGIRMQPRCRPLPRRITLRGLPTGQFPAALLAFTILVGWAVMRAPRFPGWQPSVRG
jgi:hypothetical protein